MHVSDANKYSFFFFFSSPKLGVCNCAWRVDAAKYCSPDEHRFAVSIPFHNLFIYSFFSVLLLHLIFMNFFGIFSCRHFSAAELHTSLVCSAHIFHVYFEFIFIRFFCTPHTEYSIINIIHNFQFTFVSTLAASCIQWTEYEIQRALTHTRIGKLNNAKHLLNCEAYFSAGSLFENIFLGCLCNTGNAISLDFMLIYGR